MNFIKNRILSKEELQELFQTTINTYAEPIMEDLGLEPGSIEFVIRDSRLLNGNDGYFNPHLLAHAAPVEGVITFLIDKYYAQTGDGKVFILPKSKKSFVKLFILPVIAHELRHMYQYKNDPEAFLAACKLKEEEDLTNNRKEYNKMPLEVDANEYALEIIKRYKKSI